MNFLCVSDYEGNEMLQGQKDIINAGLFENINHDQMFLFKKINLSPAL